LKTGSRSDDDAQGARQTHGVERQPFHPLIARVAAEWSLQLKAMVLERLRTPLVLIERPDPLPGPSELRLKIEACAVCRTDLHVVDGDLDHPKLPLVPGHGIVGIVDAVGPGVDPSRIGKRAGVPWLGHACGNCIYCRTNSENLCDQPLFTGYTRDGGFATEVVADADFALKLDGEADPVALAPMLCAGLIGWRALHKAGTGKRIGLYGFGAAAHIIAQICVWQGREVYAFTRAGDVEAQRFALSLGAAWAGGSDLLPPTPLDAAIIFAPVGDLVPAALRAVRKGGRVVCGGIYMSDIPAMPYSILWEEREVVSVANLTRADANGFFPVARTAGVRIHSSAYPLIRANEALADLRAGVFSALRCLFPERGRLGSTCA
jgi:propanol-preferring alcohol dehydrogenase